MLTLLRNISESSIPEPFALLEYNANFLYRMSFPTETICYYFDPVASWNFDPPLTLYLDTIASKRVLETDWAIGVMSIDDLLARGFTI
jgi:hypothetical protein